MTTNPWLCFFGETRRDAASLAHLSEEIQSLIEETRSTFALVAELETIESEARDFVAETQKVREALEALNRLPEGIASWPYISKAKRGLDYSLRRFEQRIKELSPALEKKQKGRPVQLDKVLLVGGCLKLLQKYSSATPNLESADITGLAQFIWLEATRQDFSIASWRHTLKRYRLLSEQYPPSQEGKQMSD